jgi:PTS system N-acetylglucosamine-specific IIC component
MFVAPLLYLVHAVLTGTALAIATLLNIKIGFGFSAGLIDYVLNFGKENTTNPLLILMLGVAYFAIYYFVFGFVIKRFDLATPGRGEESTGLAADWILPESQRGPGPAWNARPPARRSARPNARASASHLRWARRSPHPPRSATGTTCSLRTSWVPWAAVRTSRASRVASRACGFSWTTQTA